jgi:hypothetical protein
MTPLKAGIRPASAQRGRISPHHRRLARLLAAQAILREAQAGRLPLAAATEALDRILGKGGAR